MLEIYSFSLNCSIRNISTWETVIPCNLLYIYGKCRFYKCYAGLLPSKQNGNYGIDLMPFQMCSSR